VRWRDGERSRGLEVKGSRGLEVKGSRGLEVKVETVRKNDVLVVSCHLTTNK